MLNKCKYINQTYPKTRWRGSVCPLAKNRKRFIYNKNIICFILSISIIFCSIIPVYAAEETKMITAPAGVLMEAQTGKILYENNPHEQRPCASVTKVMTLLLVFEAIDSGKLSLDTTITASEHAASMGGSDIWLEPGETMSADDMIKATVVASANDAAVALAEQVSGSEESFVEQMNNRAKELGMKDTVFKNCNGLDEDGHITSAYDVAVMSRELIKHEKIFDYTSIWIDFLRGGKTQLVNTNKLLSSLDGVIGVKTGFTDKAGRCLVSACERNGTTLICVTLNDRNDWADHKAMYEHCFEKCSETKLEYKNDITVPVVGGVSDYAGCYSPEVRISLPVGEKSKVTAELCIKPFVYAPVLQKEKTGEVRYYYKGKQIASSPVFTKLSTAARLSGDNSVLKSIFDRIKRLLT